MAQSNLNHAANVVPNKLDGLVDSDLPLARVVHAVPFFEQVAVQIFLVVLSLDIEPVSHHVVAYANHVVLDDDCFEAFTSFFFFDEALKVVIVVGREMIHWLLKYV